MENIFEIKFSFEQNVKDNVILKFSNKQVALTMYFHIIGNVLFGRLLLALYTMNVDLCNHQLLIGHLV